MGYIIDQYVISSYIKNIIEESCYIKEIENRITDSAKERKSVIRYFGKQKTNYKNKKGRK